LDLKENKMGKILVFLMIGSLFATAYYAVGIVLLCVFLPYAAISDLMAWQRRKAREALEKEVYANGGTIVDYYTELQKHPELSYMKTFE
jgi:hypothetical protein